MTKTIRKYPTRVNIKFKSQDGEIALEHIKSLDKLRIVDGNKVTNAAILLFAKDEIIHHVHIGR